MWKEYFGYDWTQPRRDQDGVGIPCHRRRLKEDGYYSSQTDEPCFLPHDSSCCLLGFLGSVGHFRFFVALNLGIQLISEFS